MLGIYIHIPFCRKKCHYCNFFSIASRKKQTDFVDALCIEIESNKNDWVNHEIGTIYFGGGTPSLLTYDELKRIFEVIEDNYQINSDSEITLEVNPDDISIKKLNEFKKVGINRLSIGIQSFSNEDLKYLNRVHNAQQAANSIIWSLYSGFKNLSIDLIYGLPSSNAEIWEKNLEIATKFNIPHISAYALTVEDKTALKLLLKKKKILNIDEEKIIADFEFMTDFFQKNKYKHYEISNFCLEGCESVHNTNYWKQVPYIGFGPSAHSYNSTERKWNPSNLTKYIESVNNKNLISETEVLTKEQKYNEYIITSLRTIWGCSTKYITNNFGLEKAAFFERNVKKIIKENYIKEYQGIYTLTKKGKLFVDWVTLQLFLS